MSLQGSGKLGSASHALQLAVLVNAASMQANQGHLQQVLLICTSPLITSFVLFQGNLLCSTRSRVHSELTAPRHLILFQPENAVLNQG